MIQLSLEELKKDDCALIKACQSGGWNIGVSAVDVLKSNPFKYLPSKNSLFAQ